MTELCYNRAVKKKAILVRKIKTIEAIPVQQLVEQGYRILIMDVDNTLWMKGDNDLSDEVKAWLDELKASGFMVLIASNNHSRKADIIAERYGFSGLNWAMKPFIFKIVRELKKMNYQGERGLWIGDQLLTDGLCARRLGFDILVIDQKRKKDYTLTKIAKFMEKSILKRIEEYEV